MSPTRLRTRNRKLTVILVVTALFVGVAIGGSLLGKAFRSPGEQKISGGGRSPRG